MTTEAAEMMTDLIRKNIVLWAVLVCKCLCAEIHSATDILNRHEDSLLRVRYQPGTAVPSVQSAVPHVSAKGDVPNRVFPPENPEVQRSSSAASRRTPPGQDKPTEDSGPLSRTSSTVSSDAVGSGNLTRARSTSRLNKSEDQGGAPTSGDASSEPATTSEEEPRRKLDETVKIEVTAGAGDLLRQGSDACQEEASGRVAVAGQDKTEDSERTSGENCGEEEKKNPIDRGGQEEEQTVPLPEYLHTVAEVREPKIVDKDTASEGCKKPCFRKCCPTGQVFDLDSHRCRRQDLNQRNFVDSDAVVLALESYEGDQVIYGLPLCRGGAFTVVASTGENAKSQLKLNSYGVKHVNYCTDFLLQKGKEVYRSLVCDESLENAREVNAVRKASASGNVVSALCVIVIFACHAYTSKTDRMHGSLSLCFSTSVLAKSIFEAFSRVSLLAAYPNHAICAINSSVHTWLTVLCIDIARRVRGIGNMSKMMSFTRSRRRWFLIYLVFGYGLPFLQCLVGVLVTWARGVPPRRSAIYDRACLVTDRKIRQWVFFYPRICLTSASFLLMAYAFWRRRRTTAADRSKSAGGDHRGRSADRVKVEEQTMRGEGRKPGGGGGEPGGGAGSEGRPRRPEEGGGGGGFPRTVHDDDCHFCVHSAVNREAEFWQQVHLISFWIILSVLMLPLELSLGRIAIYVSYLIDSYQGIYVLFVFVLTKRKRKLFRRRIEEILRREGPHPMASEMSSGTRVPYFQDLYAWITDVFRDISPGPDNSRKDLACLQPHIL
ncbi:uncharacterized protein LOC143028165 isoform X2 [Oratosquilla oratoria]|uniref:uncharacterized protein LOC143028165 isoform X2 n=1 Tax=Oratosquilla oratoria TaxID=337810 RepID=UPI003F775159